MMQVAITELGVHNSDLALMSLKCTSQGFVVTRGEYSIYVCEDTFTSFQGQDVRNTVDTAMIDMTEKKKKKVTDVLYVTQLGK